MGFVWNGRYYTGDKRRRFVAIAYLTTSTISLGFSLHLREPHLDIRFPFFFIRIGWIFDYDAPEMPVLKEKGHIRHQFGYEQKFQRGLWPIPEDAPRVEVENENRE